jgi:GNAT superfamily N-acetyltransferase
VAGVLAFKVRRARPSDKAPLMSFIKDVWGGHDYIPSVWDDWMEDASAQMFVVVAGGVPVAMNRVRFLEDGSAWFEGVRVHPDFRGIGLATMLGENAMKVAKEAGATTFRLTSSSWNKPAHRQVARMRFAETARVSVYDPKEGSRFRPQSGVRKAKPADGKAVFDLIRRSKEFRMGAGVMWDSFSAVSLTREVVSKKVAEGAVMTADDAVGIAKLGREGRTRWNQVCFLAGGAEGAVKLVHHIFATRGEKHWRFVVVPHGSPLIGALRRDGMKRAFSLVLFERKAAKG